MIGDSPNVDDMTQAAIDTATSVDSGGDAVRMPTSLGAAPGGEAEAVRRHDLTIAESGWRVFAADGGLLGQAGQIADNFLTVVAASPSGRDMYIPREYVEDVVPGRIVLSRPRALLMDMKLDEQPVPIEALAAPRETGAHERVVPSVLAGTPYSIDSSSRDFPDGPTHQPGVGPGYLPVRGQPTASNVPTVEPQ